MQRNLAYHVYPLPGWRWNIDQLRRRLHLFDGRCVVGVVVDEHTEPPEAVQEAMPGCETVVLPNNPQLGETVTWGPIWELLRGEPGVTFHAHTKGVSPTHKEQVVRLGQSGGVPFVREVFWRPATTDTDRQQTMRLWASILYSANLDRWLEVEAMLQDYPIVGAMRTTVTVPSGLSAFAPAWYYAGSFYWVRNSDFFERDWRSVPQNFYGTESWQSQAFRISEAGCVFGAVARTNNMQTLAYWVGVNRYFSMLSV